MRISNFELFVSVVARSTAPRQFSAWQGLSLSGDRQIVAEWRGRMAWKPATPQLELVLPAGSASQFHPTAVEKPTRPARRSGSLIRQALYLDQEHA